MAIRSLVVLLLLSSAALAQQPTPPPFAPITIDQQTWQVMRNSLGQFKHDEVNPLILWWESLERAAQQKVAPPSKPESPKPTQPEPK